MRNDDPSSHDAQTLDSATADQAETQKDAGWNRFEKQQEDADQTKLQKDAG